MFFTWVYLRTKFHWSQYLVSHPSYIQHCLTHRHQGVFICCLGMGLLVYSDQTQNAPDGPGRTIWVGDVYMLAGATLYGFSQYQRDYDILFLTR